MDNAGDGVAELDLGVADGVAADDDGAGLLKAFDAALKNLFEPCQARVFVVGIADEVESGERLASHGVDVAEGIGGGDLAIDKGLVDDRRKEVDGLNERNLIGEAVDARVVVRFGADEKVRVVERRQVAQDLRDPLGGQLARSTGARSVIDQAFFLAEEKHQSQGSGVRSQGSGVSNTTARGASKVLCRRCGLCGVFVVHD
jgi:hypothetical protein